MAHAHPTAQIDAKAELADDVEVGAFSIVGPNVRIGAGSTIGPHVVVTGRTTLGARNRIFQFASIGDIPQDRGTTTIGNGNWLLGYVHIAHDCILGDHTTFSNNAQLAGHVVIGDYVTMGGFTGVHQFCRIGAHAMVAGGGIVLQDVPPFVTVSGYPAKPAGTNSEGLRRRGFSAADIAEVKRAYRMLYREGHSLAEAKAVLADAAERAPVLAPLVSFLAVSGRGIVR